MFLRIDIEALLQDCKRQIALILGGIKKQENSEERKKREKISLKIPTTRVVSHDTPRSQALSTTKKPPISAMEKVERIGNR
jgi:hypothetical protein